MGQDFISAGWTSTRSRKTDEEQVKQFLDRLSTEEVLTHIERLDPQGRFETEIEYDDDLAILDTAGNNAAAQEVRDALKYGASVAFDSDGRLGNLWEIPGTTLGFTVMGGGSYGDDPFEGYTDVVMLIDSLGIWDGLRDLTDVVCGGLPHADVVAAHREEETA